jgi:uncharacterized protein
MKALMDRWIEVAEGIRVTGEGMAWLPEQHAIVVADIHIGYDLAARRRGGYLPPVLSGATIGDRIATIARRYEAGLVVVAGDLRHSTRDVDALEREEVVAFANAVRQHVSLEIVLGNHDAGDAIAGTSQAALRLGQVDIVHAPPRTEADRLTVCGHLHPRVTVRDETGASARYPCALVSATTIILPAYSEWAGGTEASRLARALPGMEWRALPVHDGIIADLGIRFRAGET